MPPVVEDGNNLYRSADEPIWLVMATYIGSPSDPYSFVHLLFRGALLFSKNGISPRHLYSSDGGRCYSEVTSERWAVPTL